LLFLCNVFSEREDIEWNGRLKACELSIESIRIESAGTIC